MAQVILWCWVFFETIKTLGVYLPDKAPIFLCPFFPSIHLFGRVKPACNELGIFELLWFKMRGVCSGARVNNNMTDRAFNVVRCFWKYNFKIKSRSSFILALTFLAIGRIKLMNCTFFS